jgi:hypothetical protein
MISNSSNIQVDEQCREVYASENIQAKAWKEYHQLLCVGSNANHPYKQLVEKARYALRNPFDSFETDGLGLLEGQILYLLFV